jgi:enoyl-CoA hydratase/carnithine racemase
MRYLLTGDSFNAEEAKAMNIVTEVVTPGEELDRAIELAQRISDQAPLAVQATLASARNRFDISEQKLIFERLGSLMGTKDVGRGMQAFMTKTKAEFKGD